MNNSRAREIIKKFLTASFFTMLAPLIFVIGSSGVFLYTCNRDKIYDRPQTVSAEPLLEVNIPSDVDVFSLQQKMMMPISSSTDWQWENMRTPIGVHGANVFLKHASSLSQAQMEFRYICENGWTFGGERNKRTRSRLIYGGEQDNQFCASPVIEGKYDMTSLCAPTGNFESYVIFQKGDILIAIYENEGNGLSLTGNFTNKAIQDLSTEILAESK